MDRGAWQTSAHGVTKESNTTQRLNGHHQRQNPEERCQSEDRGLLKERFETQMERKLQKTLSQESRPREGFIILKNTMIRRECFNSLPGQVM